MVHETTKRHFVSAREGLGKDFTVVSIHMDYSRYASFMRQCTLNLADTMSDLQSFIVNLKSGLVMKPFDLAYLADGIEEFLKQ